MVEVVPGRRFHGRIQGVVTLVVSLAWILLGVLTASAAFGLLMVMFGLLVSAPFGTIAYLATWGFFPVTRVATVPGLLLVLKLVFLVLLVASQQDFAKAKVVVGHVAASLVLQLALGIVHCWLPSLVVSLGDQAMAALVFAIVAAGGALGAFALSIPAVLNAIRVWQSATR